MSPKTRGRVIITRVLSTVALASCLQVPLAAQLSIRVVDANGSPVPAVRIDVYGSGEILDVVSTSAQGLAELSTERWGEVRRISLSHVGFQTLIVQTADIPGEGVIRMESRATELEGLTVEAGELCPVVDGPRARRLWAEVASLYAADTGSRSWLAYLSLYSASIPETDLHRVSDPEAADYAVAGGAGVIHGGDHTPRSLDDRVLAEGYSWPPLLVDGTSSARDLAWAYPQLEREHAHHFASPAFGALHNFAVGSESSEQTTVIFCDNGHGTGATIRGVITLVPGESFLSAEWIFVARDRDEGAGGRVSFASSADAAGRQPHLVASEGYFYRHDGREPPYPDLPRTYSRWGVTNARWHFNPTADRPCNAGLSFHGDPPRSPEGQRFGQCVADHWGRE